MILTHRENPEEVDRWIVNAEKEINNMEKHLRFEVCLRTFRIVSGLMRFRSITRSGRVRHLAERV